MRVLFAVSNDNITTSIINKYQQKYKEIITNKNVYYFNAIINELQKNKFYDAIVIGEDLEPISNNNYNEIDKFLFEKLDGISDEASKPTGEDIPIIFICSDRRIKSDQLLVKLFGIGIYNAIIGNDRSIDTVCNLINKPRNKKEAKLYYGVDSEDVTPYERGDDQDVSETEIQNILAHYRKIGLNEKKCVESFDRIAEQYNETQLRLIINFLPKDVKNILEVNSDKYKKLMSNGTVLSNGKYSPYNKQNPKVPGKIDVLTKDLEKTNLSNPVIIPSTINVNRSINTSNNMQNKQPIMNKNLVQPKPMQQNTQPNMQPKTQQNIQTIVQPNMQLKPQQNMQPIVQTNLQQNVPQSEETNVQQNLQQNAQQNINKVQGVDKGMQALINDNDNNNQNLESVAPNVEPKRGRGRPKKVQVVPTVANSNNDLSGNNLDTNSIIEPTAKRKRGRPSKKINPQPLENSIDNQKQQNPETLTNSFDDILPGLEETKEEPVDLFGMSPIDESPIDTTKSENDILPGLEDINTNTENINSDTNLFDLDLEENTISQDDNISNNVQETVNNATYTEPNIYNNDLYNMQSPEIDNNTDLYNISNTNQDSFVNPYNLNNFDNNSYQNMFGMDNIYGNSESYTGSNNQIQNNQTENVNQMQDQNQMQYNQMQDTNPMQYNQSQNSNQIQNNQTQNTNTIQYNQIQDTNPMQYNQTQNTNTIQYNPAQNLNQTPYNQNYTNNLINTQNENPINNNVIAGNGKIAIFVGTTKNGTSFIVNNLAQLLSQNGVRTAILDLTKNKNSYYMFTDNDANLMKIATDSIKNLSNGIVNGINVNKNLTVFTSLPDEIEEVNKDMVIQTLSNNFEIVLLDGDFNTNTDYFLKANEIYLIQSMDTFTIQPLTQFLSDLKLKNVLDESKLRVVINKYVRLRKLDERMIIGGMSKYNEPSMTLQRDLFNAQTIRSVTIPFEMETYAKYLESIAMCNLSLNGYSQNFINSLETLKNMVYPLISGGNFNNNSQIRTEEKRGLFGNKKNKNASTQETQFSNNVNDTLNKMRTNNF